MIVYKLLMDSMSVIFSFQISIITLSLYQFKLLQQVHEF